MIFDEDDDEFEYTNDRDLNLPLSGIRFRITEPLKQGDCVDEQRVDGDLERKTALIITRLD